MTYNRKLLSKYPVSKYLDLIDQYPGIEIYTYASADILQLCREIITEYGEQKLEIYHKDVLISLINRSRAKLKDAPLSEDIKGLYEMDFSRIIKDIQMNTHKEGFYLYPQDKFMKDIGVCSLRIIPAGAQKINVYRLPRRFLFSNGILQFFRGTIMAMLTLKGFQPIYDMHTDSHDPHLISEWHYDGWVRFYKRVAELLKVNSNIIGIYGIGWPFDPQLEHISPRQAYLRKLVTENGGYLFYIGPSMNAIKSSTFKSEKRRSLYEAGKYIPKEYMVVWPRKSLIAWANGSC